MDFRRLPVRRGDRVLDMGCGAGRHAFEVLRRGAHVVAFDHDAGELRGVADVFAAMYAADEAPEGSSARTACGDALTLPFGDGSFDRIIAAEVLEHIPHDMAAMAELFRVLRPGGHMAVTVPSWLPERICWAMSREYHDVAGGHVRIYTRTELEGKLRRSGLAVRDHHHAHGLHSPYWWAKCAVGVEREGHPIVSAYHKLLVWDLMRRPAVTRAAETVLNPLIGKSLVVYLSKPATRPPSPYPEPGHPRAAVTANGHRPGAATGGGTQDSADAAP